MIFFKHNLNHFPRPSLYLTECRLVYDIRPQLMKLGLTSKFINKSRVITYPNACKEFLAFLTII